VTSGPSTSHQLPQTPDAAAVEAALAPAFGLLAEPYTRRARCFYDTFDGRVRAAGRILHHEAGQLVLTDADGRQEAAVPIARAPKRLFVAELPDGPLRGALHDPVDVRALTPIARVGGQERVLRVLDDEEKTVARIVVEEPSLDGGDRLPARLRVDPVRGYDKAAARVTRLLEEALPLSAADASLCDEAVRRAGGTPGGISSRPAVDLDPGERADRAAARISVRLLEIIELNLPGTLADVDSEFLHDLRVAVRRTRSLQRELRGVFVPDELKYWRGEFKWLQTITGPSRDLDVYVLEFDDFRDALPQRRRADVEPLRELLLRRQATAHRRMRSELSSPRTTKALQGWGELLVGLEAGTIDGPDAQTPIVELASKRIATVHRKMVKAGRAIHDETPAVALHELRKKGKELRYLLEFFTPLYPKKVIKPMVRSLKALQDTLGRFQDREVQAELIGSLADDVRAMDDGTAALMAMGLLVEHLHVEQSHARAEFADRFATFASDDQRALVRDTFR